MSDAKTADALAARLFALVGPEKTNTDTFLSIVKGGIAADPEDLAWLTKPWDGLTAEDKRQVREWGAVFNNVPKTAGPWQQSGSTMDKQWINWVRNAKYPEITLTPEQNDALVKANKIVKENLMDYLEGKGEYDAAVSVMQEAIIAGRDQVTITKLKKAVSNAKTKWEVLGNKTAYEKALAERVKLQSFGFATAFNEYQTTWDSLQEAYSYPFTGVVPKDFMNSNLWTTASFSTSEKNSSSSTSSSSWGGGANVRYGLWSFGANASHSSERSEVQSDESDLTVEFEFCRTPIMREWFDGSILFGKDWTWPDGITGKLSNGTFENDGSWPLIPTEVVWTRNVKVTFSSASSSLQEAKDTVSGGGSIGFAFFGVSANYSKSTSSRKEQVKFDGNSITFLGTSISAFLCQLMPKVPAADSKPATASAYLSGIERPLSSRKTMSKVELERSHAALDGIIDTLKRKGKDILSKSGEYIKEEAERRAKEIIKSKGEEYTKKATDAMKKWANDKLNRLKQQQIVYEEEQEVRDAWRGYSEIIQQSCFDVLLTPEEIVQGAKIAADLEPRNVDAATDIQASASVPSGLQLAFVTSKIWPAGKTLRVRFMDGDPEIQKKVAKQALAWQKDAKANINIVFGNDKMAEIRISFLGTGSWSLIGTDCLLPSYDNEPTMNFGWFTRSTSDEEIRRTVVHEFGHALGLIHEHNNPRGNISWNEPLARRFYKASQGWTDQQVDVNIFQKYAISMVRASAYDRQSIMHYPIPAELLTNPKDAVGMNMDLSTMDKEFARQVYPPGAAGLQNVDTKQGVKRMAVIKALGQASVRQTVLVHSKTDEDNDSYRKSHKYLVDSKENGDDDYYNERSSTRYKYASNGDRLNKPSHSSNYIKDFKENDDDEQYEEEEDNDDHAARTQNLLQYS